MAGAWVGTSEFADAAGFAVVAELATRFGDSPINAFTLMKVIGRDIWIGIWCLILSVVSVVFWEKKDASQKAVSAGIVWERFPKFVIGFLTASVIMSFVASRVPAGHVGVAKMKGAVQGVKYDADFAGYAVPESLRDRVSVDLGKGTLTAKGRLERDELKTLQDAAATQDQKFALNQLATASSWFESVLQPEGDLADQEAALLGVRAVLPVHRPVDAVRRAHDVRNEAVLGVHDRRARQRAARVLSVDHRVRGVLVEAVSSCAQRRDVTKSLRFRVSSSS